MTAKLSETQTDNFEHQVCRDLGEITARLTSIDGRLAKGDENFKELNGKVDKLACMQPVSECTPVKPGGWGKPVTVGAGATAVIFFVFDMVQKYLQMKGLI